MYKNKILIAVLFAVSVFQAAVSQNSTNSPYTRFGYGDVTESVSVNSRGMGGTAIGNYSPRTINPVNPASHSSVDSLTFMFDIATGFRFSRFSDKDNSKVNTLTGNLEYLTIRFPLAKGLGFSAGLLPYSFTGYNFMFRDSLQMPGNTQKVPYTKSFNGSGGFSQLYGGLAVRLIDHISVGVNAYYLFGNINNFRSLAEGNSPNTATIENDQIHASDFRLRYGVQYFNTFNKKHHLTLGAIYENKTKLNGTFTSTLNETLLKENKDFELPQTIGAGVSYNFDEKLTVAADYKTLLWKNALYFGKKDTLSNSSTFALGAEYVPNPRGNRYADRIRYRVGLNASNPYYKVNSATQPYNYGASLGIAIPLRDAYTNKMSYVNLALEYGKIGASSTLREDYLKLTISASLNDFWFFKRKL